ncbi:MAG: hypothetical protein NUW37_04180 [Planctomycetes bacterium]|nr:hypothetical protein [Planctomycetota bacterium]
MKPIKSGTEHYKTTFGLSSRLSARMAALAAEGLAPSEALLETLADEAELAKLLLAPAVLKGAAEWTTESINDALSAIDVKTNSDWPLAVAWHEGERVLALLEEVPGGISGRSDPAIKSDTSIVPAAKNSKWPTSALVPKIDAQDLYLRLTTETEDRALSSIVRTWARIEGNPKIAIPPLLELLENAKPVVRGEVIDALVHLGLSYSAGTLLKRFLSEPNVSESKRDAALEEILASIGRAGGNESFLLLEILRSVYTGLSSAQAIAVLSKLSAILADGAAQAFDVSSWWEKLLVQAGAESEIVGERTMQLIAEIESRGDERVRFLLTKELHESGSLDLIRLIVVYMACHQHADDGDMTEISAREFLAQARAHESEFRFNLWEPIKRYKERIRRQFIRLLVEEIDAEDEGFPFVLRMITEIASEAEEAIDPDVELANRLCELYGRSSFALKNQIAESGLLQAAEPTIRRTAARKMISDLSGKHLPEQGETTKFAIASLRESAVEAVTEYLLVSRNEEHHLQAAEALAFLDFDGGLRNETIERSLKQLTAMFSDEDAELSRGPFALAIGYMARVSSVDAGLARYCAEILSSWIFRTSSTYDVIEGLSNAALNPGIESEFRAEVARMYLRFLDMNISGKLMKIQKAEADSDVDFIYEIGRETTVYSVLFPRLLGALGKFVTIERDDVAREIALASLSKWDSLMKMEIVWSPANVQDLARLIASYCQRDDSDAKLRSECVAALLQQAEMMPVIELLSDVCEKLKEREGLELREKLLRILKQRTREMDSLEPHERSKIVGVALRLLLTPDADSTNDRISALRGEFLTIAAGMYRSGSIRIGELVRAYLLESGIDEDEKEYYRSLL